MIRIAVYGKGGIGKSTTVSNVAAALAEMGLRVMQIGCDPKADSTILLRHGEAVPAVLDLYNKKKQSLQLEDMIRIGYNNVICVEAGGPTPGLGGLILNRRDVPREEKKVAELADDFQTAVIGTLSHSSQVALAEEQQKTLMECYPESEMAEEYRALAVQMYRICGGVLKDENDAVRDEYMHKCMDEHMDKYIDEHMDKYTDERMNEHINEHINECMNGQTQEDV